MHAALAVGKKAAKKILTREHLVRHVVSVICVCISREKERNGFVLEKCCAGSVSIE